MKRILVNLNTFSSAGNFTPLLLKLRHFKQCGHHITIFGNAFIKDIIDEMDILTGYDFVCLNHKHEARNKLVFMLDSFLRNIKSIPHAFRFKGKYDVVYTISSVLDLALFAYMMKIVDSGIKWNTILDNKVPISDPGNKIIRFLAWLFYRASLLLLRKADTIYVISQDLESMLLATGFAPDTVVLTGNAVESDLIRAARPREELAMDALFVGRINETKGIYDCLKVLDRVRQDIPGFVFGILGNGDDKTVGQFRQAIADMGLEDNVAFHGFVSGRDKFDIIKSSRSFWFLSVSESESFGIALLEAVCCGVPAFAYDLPQYKPIYRNHEVTFLKKHDTGAVARAVLELFRRGEFTNPRGELLLDSYSWDDIAAIENSRF